jgi:cell division topological specificity factor
MNIFNFLLPKKKTACLAKERLQIIISHERTNNTAPDFLPKMRKELIAVIAKYIPLQEDQINIQMHRQDNHSTIEMNFVIPNEEQ